MGHYKIVFSRRVQKDLKKIPKHNTVKILVAIKEFATSPRPIGSKKLKREILYRIRIGVYRVVYEIKNDHLIIMIIKIGHRKSIYN